MDKIVFYIILTVIFIFLIYFGYRHYTFFHYDWPKEGKREISSINYSMVSIDDVPQYYYKDQIYKLNCNVNRKMRTIENIFFINKELLCTIFYNKANFIKIVLDIQGFLRV